MLYESLRNHAQTHPDKPAVIFQGRSLTYAQLDTQSDSLAAALSTAGLNKGDRVALFLDNSDAYVIAYFGVQKAGGAVVAFNTQLVARELAPLLADCTPFAVITDKAKESFISEASRECNPQPLVITVERSTDGTPVFSLNPGSPLPSWERDRVRGDSLASIIYTSGTTGKPKGVMLSHANIIANTESIVQYLQLTGDDKVMAILPFFYSYGASLLTTHILVGGTLVIDNRFMYPNVVLDAMEKEEVTGFAGVPSHFAILLRKSALKKYKLPKLRYVTQAGGAMSPAMIQEFIEILPHVKFYVMYGQTEATARLSYLEPEQLVSKMGSIGKAIPGVTLQVLDDNGQPVKPGETGEIVASGKNIMSGYWKSPEETSKVLKDGRLYTGDLAKVDEDGFLYVVSRKKDMIKSGANRISPLEIEHVVSQIPGVLESAAIGIPDEILGEAIKLFVVRVPDAICTEVGVTMFCRQNLSFYKVPKIIEFIPALPKTTSGKIKREDLKQLHSCKAQTSSL